MPGVEVETGHRWLVNVWIVNGHWWLSDFLTAGDSMANMMVMAMDKDHRCDHRCDHPIESLGSTGREWCSVQGGN